VESESDPPSKQDPTAVEPKTHVSEPDETREIQIELGRQFLAEYRETFRALAK
jgi:hypothetical protein